MLSAGRLKRREKELITILGFSQSGSELGLYHSFRGLHLIYRIPDPTFCVFTFTKSLCALPHLSFLPSAFLSLLAGWDLMFHLVSPLSSELHGAPPLLFLWFFWGRQVALSPSGSAPSPALYWGLSAFQYVLRLMCPQLWPQPGEQIEKSVLSFAVNIVRS